MIKKHRPPHIHPDNSQLFLTGRTYGGFSYLTPKRTKEYFLDKLNFTLEKYQIDLDAWVVLDNHYHFLIRVKEGKNVSPFVKELHGATAHFIKKNLPSLITEAGQRLAREATSWDKRQTKRLSSEEKKLKREMNFASTGSERELKFTNAGKRGLKSANTKDVIAQFIARHKRQFRPEVYRGLKSAITKGYLINPVVLIPFLVKDTPIWYQYVDHVIRNEGNYFRHLNYIHQNPIKHDYVKKMNNYKFLSVHQFLKEKGKEWLADCFEKYPIVNFEPEGIAD